MIPAALRICRIHLAAKQVHMTRLPATWNFLLSSCQVLLLLYKLAESEAILEWVSCQDAIISHADETNYQIGLG